MKNDDGHCPYCNHLLDKRYYFCANCGSPWRGADDTIFQVPPPPAPTLDRRILLLARPGITLFSLLAIGIIAFSIIGFLLFGAEHVDRIYYLESAFLIVLTLIFALRYRQDIAKLFRTSGLANRYFAVGIPILAVLLIVNFTYHNFLQRALGIDDNLSLMETMSAYGISTAGIFALLCLEPAVLEEIAFRGLLQEWLSRCVGEMKTWFGVAFLFMLLHFSILSMPYLFLVGFFLCWIRSKTGSIYPPMIFHFLHNAGVLVAGG